MFIVWPFGLAGDSSDTRQMDHMDPLMLLLKQTSNLPPPPPRPAPRSSVCDTISVMFRQWLNLQ